MDGDETRKAVELEHRLVKLEAEARVHNDWRVDALARLLRVETTINNIEHNLDLHVNLNTSQDLVRRTLRLEEQSREVEELHAIQEGKAQMRKTDMALLVGASQIINVLIHLIVRLSTT